MTLVADILARFEKLESAGTPPVIDEGTFFDFEADRINPTIGVDVEMPRARRSTAEIRASRGHRHAAKTRFATSLFTCNDTALLT